LIFTHTLNEEKRIGRLLDSLKKQKHIEFRVVISDNFSTDATVKVINSYCKDINLTLIYPPEQILLLDHFFYVAEHCKNILSKDEGIIYIGADDYFLEPTYLEELIETRVKFPKSIVVPNFVINSLSSVTRVTTRGQYKNRSKYVRLFRFLIANHHHGSRFNLGLFNKEMFIYRLDRELMYSKKYDFKSRNSIGEFFTLIDLILKYTVIVNSRATFVKEVNNRNITDVRENENHTKIEISKLNTIRNLLGKNMSTFRLLKHRRAKHKAIIFAYRVVGFISFVRNSSYDLYLYCKKHFVK
jgi:glycosyltransferase involved in cell wall biosynthesis